MTIKQYLLALREGWKLIAIVVVASLAVGLLYVLLAPRQYSASISFYVLTQNSRETDTTGAYQGSLLSQERVKTYVELLNSDTTRRSVIQQLGLQTSSEELEQNISAASNPDSVLLTATVTQDSAPGSAAVANALGRSFTELVARLEAPAGPTVDSTVAIRTVEPALVPEEPVAPRPIQDLLVALIAGVLLGCSAAIGRSALDTRIKSADQLSALTGRPTLSQTDKVDDTATVAALSGIDGRPIEPYLRLRTNLTFLDVDQERRVILITSPQPSEGKTTTSCNLALALARAGRTTLLIDCDLRKPNVAETLSLSPDVGLSSVLSRRIGWRDAIQVAKSTPRFSVITSGPLPPNPSELLGSKQMADLLRELSSSFDSIIIDSAPVLPVVDTAALAPQTNGVVLVCKHRSTATSSMLNAQTALTNVGAEILGTHLTMFQGTSISSYGTYGEYGATNGSMPNPSSEAFAGVAPPDEASITAPANRPSISGNRPTPSRRV